MKPMIFFRPLNILFLAVLILSVVLAFNLSSISQVFTRLTELAISAVDTANKYLPRQPGS